MIKFSVFLTLLLAASVCFAAPKKKKTKKARTAIGDCATVVEGSPLVAGVETNILSVNAGKTEDYTFKGETVNSSLRRTRRDEIEVTKKGVVGDSFRKTDMHGREHSAVSAVGVSSIRDFLDQMKIEDYEPGMMAENLTLDNFDEADLSVGDVFQFGEVVLQVTGPRILCKMVNFQVQNSKGLSCLTRNRRTGVYFRVLKGGVIRAGDPVKRIRRAAVPFPLLELYEKLAFRKPLSLEQYRRAVANGAFPKDWLKEWMIIYESPLSVGLEGLD